MLRRKLKTFVVLQGKSSDKGNDSNDILKTDGNLNWDVFVKLLTSCGTAMNMEGTVKLVNGFASDCGLKAASGKEKMEPYKVAVSFLSSSLVPSHNYDAQIHFLVFQNNHNYFLPVWGNLRVQVHEANCEYISSTTCFPSCSKY